MIVEVFDFSVVVEDWSSSCNDVVDVLPCEADPVRISSAGRNGTDATDGTNQSGRFDQVDQVDQLQTRKKAYKTGNLIKMINLIKFF